MGDAFGGAQPSQSAPPAAGLDNTIGTSGDYARADHTHASKVQRMVGTTDASGNVTMTFARPFTNPPAVSALANTTGNPIALSITAKSITSVTINAKISSPLPSSILSLSALLNLNIFANPAANVQIDIFAAEVTQ